MKMRTIKLRTHDVGLPFPFSSGQASTKPKPQAQQHTADKADINRIHKAFWSRLIGQ